MSNPFVEKQPGMMHLAKRVVILAACAGRTREEAAAVLGIGVRTLSDFLRQEGFKPRCVVNGPCAVDVALLEVFIHGYDPIELGC